MTLEQQRDIIQAAMDGKQIQVRPLTGRDWQDVNPDIFNFTGFKYRVKPEPREFWINFYDKADGGLAYSTRDRADQAATAYRTSVIKVREVIED